jgi:hypothetical protein
MMSDSIEQQVARMRREFDEAFARAPAAGPGEEEQFLAISAGGGRYAVRLSEVALLARTPPLVSMPAHAEGFLGLVSLRAGATPVFSIARLLSEPADAAAWLVVSAGTDPGTRLAFAFGEWEGYARQPKGTVETDKLTYKGNTYVVIDLAALVKRLHAAAGEER